MTGTGLSHPGAPDLALIIPAWDEGDKLEMAFKARNPGPVGLAHP